MLDFIPDVLAVDVNVSEVSHLSVNERLVLLDAHVEVAHCNIVVRLI